MYACVYIRVGWAVKGIFKLRSVLFFDRRIYFALHVYLEIKNKRMKR